MDRISILQALKLFSHLHSGFAGKQICSYVYMVLSPKWKATLLQLLYQCEAHTLPFSV